MTDLLARVDVEEEISSLERQAAKATAVTRPMAMALATLSAAAGVIHLVMVPTHTGEYTPEGVAFVAAGWLQLLFAFWLWRRPTRALLAVVAAANLAFVGAWAVTRTWGSPFGPHAGIAEPTSIVDVTCVALEGALVLLAVALLIRPQLGAVAFPAGIALIVPVAAVLLTSAVLISPEARNHTHGLGSTSATAAAAGAPVVASDGHAHGGAAAAAPAIVNPLLPGPETGFSQLSNGHHHQIQNLPMSPATRSELKDQLAVTREVARQYPTVADAEAAGYRRAGPYSPGLGAHYIGGYGELGSLGNGENLGYVDEQALRHPLAIIYDGTAPDSPVAGFMYYSFMSTPPEGFAGDNDVWHYHENTCISYNARGEVDAPFGADLPVTQEQCAAAGGFIIPVTQYMVHVWSVPGYDMVPGGVFAEENPALDCADGSYWRVPQHEWADHPLDICQAR